MQILEGIIAIVLNTLLLIPIIIVSQSVRTMFEKIEVMKTDLALESSIAGIPLQKLGDAEALLNEVTRILSSQGAKWSEVELLSKKNGRMVVENSEASNNPSGRGTRLVRIIRVSSEDIVHIVVVLKND